jgi:predicted nuclease of predicted toxin-antitoxin system
LRILLDHNLPRQLVRLLPDHDVGAAALLGWAELGNGELLRQAEAAGFPCMITGDRNIAYQQNLTGRKIALVVLNSTRREVILPQVGAIVGVLDRVVEGAYVEVTPDLPPLRRRPFTGPAPWDKG